RARVDVDGDHAVVAVGGQGVAEHERGDGLSGAAGAAEHDQAAGGVQRGAQPLQFGGRQLGPADGVAAGDHAGQAAPAAGAAAGGVLGVRGDGAAVGRGGGGRGAAAAGRGGAGEQLLLAGAVVELQVGFVVGGPLGGRL